MLMKKILNVSEMKQVRGGAQISSMCGEGEQLYFCRTSFEGGAVSTGSVSAKSAASANVAIIKKYMDEAQIAATPQCF